MATKGVLKSFRFAQSESDWLVNTSKSKGITQTDLLRKLINDTDNRIAKSKVNKTVVQLQDAEADDEVLQFLATAGIGTASGLIGYHLAGWVREQMDLNEDKGIQIYSGLIVGLASVLLREYTRKKA
jgi:hypothetical protein